jgi:hypothetical protein
MEDTETPRMCNYGESKTTQIMMATVPHITSGSGLRKFLADGFLFDRVYTVKYEGELMKYKLKFLSSFIAVRVSTQEVHSL